MPPASRLRIEHEMDAMNSTLSLVEAGVGYTILCYAATRPRIVANDCGGGRSSIHRLSVI